MPQYAASHPACTRTLVKPSGVDERRCRQPPAVLGEQGGSARRASWAGRRASTGPIEVAGDRAPHRSPGEPRGSSTLARSRAAPRSWDRGHESRFTSSSRAARSRRPPRHRASRSSSGEPDGIRVEHPRGSAGFSTPGGTGPSSAWRPGRRFASSRPRWTSGGRRRRIDRSCAHDDFDSPVRDQRRRSGAASAA